MSLAAQWRQIRNDLPESWAEAQLELTVADAGRSDRAAILLAPAMPGRRGNRFRFTTAPGGSSPSPGAVVRLVARLDGERIRGELKLAGVVEGVAEPTDAESERRSLAEAWDAALATLPPDWSDVYAELELRSTDYLERAALLCAPLNPSRFGPEPVFRFRVAARFGYGASPVMVRRCLERLDAEPIDGETRILRVLSDTKPVATQGPVWYVGGRAV